MTSTTKEVIIDLLTQQLNMFKASFEHFKHQSSLPEQHRVTDIPEDVMKEKMITLRVGLSTTDTALTEMRQIHPDNAEPESD